MPAQPLFDPELAGKYIKLGDLGLMKIGNVASIKEDHGGGKKKLLVHKKGGGAPLVYRGDFVDRCKAVLKKEGVPEI